MKVDAVELRWLAPSPGQNGAAVPSTPLHAVEVRLHACGCSGWGEVALGARPDESPEWAGASFLTLRDCIAPAIAGHAFDSAEALRGRIDAVRGWSATKAAVDMAWWDLLARARRVPLWSLLGGDQRPIVEVSLRCGREFGPLAERLQAAQREGFGGVTLQTGPGEDVQVLRLVRQDFPALGLRIDGRERYRLEHREHLFRLDDFQIRALQQPLPAEDLVGHAMLAESLATPICLGKSVASSFHLEQVLDLQCARSVALDVVRLGGISAARDLAGACTRSGLPFVVESYWGRVVPWRASVALAGIPGAERLLVDAGDAIPVPGEEFAAELERGSDGHLRPRLWTEPGHGLEPSDVVDPLCVHGHAIVS